ncbi:hypothetical protein METBIDRAFT_19783, partial [Metschnikowia bicuspidata var. bicuspidata NRRL YB-4993]
MFNSTLIETDLDGNLVNNGEMPFWLRDIIERAFSASGIRTNKKVASKDAIASLQNVDLADLSNDSCPICYETYTMEKNKKKKANPEDEVKESLKYGNKLDKIAHKMVQKGVSIPTLEENRVFRDPYLFIPVDSTAHNHLRFPIMKLYTKDRVTHSEMFPALKQDTQSSVDTSNCEHIPVSMPHCGHVFGKPCIIEWLNGHVSCPLCRKEVEALRDTDPLSKKLALIKENCNFVLTLDPDLFVSHIANCLTDIFNPPRKTMNPLVVPLTDTTVPQVWATPLYPLDMVAEYKSNAADPPLILTRKFPLSHF